MANERRRAPRYPLIATAQIIEPQTNLRLRGRTSDLSLVGCYVEMRNALPVRTEIRVQIIHNDVIFSALGVITHCLPNMGMGVRFTDVQLDQHEKLQGWLAALAPERGQSRNHK
jgi:c-di-GMP-binding flagellar brake protein YcgR